MPRRIAQSLSALEESHLAFQPTSVPTLSSPPTPLSFLRSVHRNTPFIVRGGCASWPATRQWRHQEYLCAKMGDGRVKVANTPGGDADAVADLRGAGRGFRMVKPFETEERMAGFLDHVVAQERGQRQGGWVKYAQSQNDNLRTGCFRPLSFDVPASIAWADEALESEPDAVNVWIGNARSVTALHRDPYENLYAQAVGRKRFMLLGPAMVRRVEERVVRGARWEVGKEGGLEVVDDAEDGEEEGDGFPGVTSGRWKGDEEGVLVAELDEGDMLYLPALWYHQVEQECGAEGFCCSVNYWYDIDYGAPLFSLHSFLRDIAAISGTGEEEELTQNEEA